MAGLLLGKDELAVGEDIQHAASAQAQLYLVYSGLLFQFTFQAPGLMANIGSNKTALDLDFHVSTIWTVRCRVSFSDHCKVTSRKSGSIVVSQEMPPGRQMAKELRISISLKSLRTPRRQWS